MEKDLSDNRTEKRKTGDRGEDAAVSFLLRKGYQIAARNFRCKTGELDIAATLNADQKEGIIAFVEVKVRKSSDFGLPCQAVNEKKQRRLIRSAQFFLLKNPQYRRLQPRMDIIEILNINDEMYIRHLPNAF